MTGTYKATFLGHEWIGNYMVNDLRETAADLRREADFLDLKADLLAEQMRLAAQATVPLVVEGRGPAT